MQGANIGHSVHIDSLEIMDLDQIEIGDDVAIGEGCTIVAHRFENGLLKFEKVHPLWAHRIINVIIRSILRISAKHATTSFNPMSLNRNSGLP